MLLSWIMRGMSGKERQERRGRGVTVALQGKKSFAVS